MLCRHPCAGKDRPAIITWVNHHGAVIIQATRDFTVKTVQKAELILPAALDPASAHRARRGEFIKYLDHFDLLQTARN